MQQIPTIISGGQTGADRAALDWALSQNVPCGGWCPKGRKAEDGPIHESYPLRESTSASYLQRTEWNVRDSDGTVLFSLSPSLSGGSKRTVDFAKKHQKPWLHIHAGQTDCEKRLRSFLADNAILILNVAGPRKSKEPGVEMFVMQTLERAFKASK
jgi:Circularly permutated YpsA SLOG family